VEVRYQAQKSGDLAP